MKRVLLICAIIMATLAPGKGQDVMVVSSDGYSGPIRPCPCYVAKNLKDSIATKLKDLVEVDTLGLDMDVIKPVSFVAKNDSIVIRGYTFSVWSKTTPTGHNVVFVFTPKYNMYAVVSGGPEAFDWFTKVFKPIEAERVGPDSLIIYKIPKGFVGM